MRSLLMIGLLVAWSTTACAQVSSEEVAGEALPPAIVITPELVEAHQAYQLAQMRWQQYRFVDLPRQRQLLNDQLRFGEEQLKVLRRRNRDYRPFLRVGEYSPVRTAAEDNRLALLAVEQDVRRLRLERINLMRFSRHDARQYQLDVLRTAARVQQVMAEAERVEQ